MVNNPMITMNSNKREAPDSMAVFDLETRYHLEELLGREVDPFVIEQALIARNNWRNQFYAEHCRDGKTKADSKDIRARERAWNEARLQLAREDDMRHNHHLYTPAGFVKYCTMSEFMPDLNQCENCPQVKAGRLCDEAPVAEGLETPKKKKRAGWSDEARARVKARNASKKNAGRRIKLVDDIIRDNPEISAIAEKDYSRAFELAWPIADEQVDKEKNQNKKKNAE